MSQRKLFSFSSWRPWFSLVSTTTFRLYYC